MGGFTYFAVFAAPSKIDTTTDLSKRYYSIFAIPGATRATGLKLDLNESEKKVGGVVKELIL